MWLVAAPRVEREAEAKSDQTLLLIANHVTDYDAPLVLYALPGRMRRHVAAAMAANMLRDWRRRRNQGSWFLDALGPLTYLVVTVVFNVFPLPRSAGFRRSFQHAGEALDHGYNVLVFPEGRESEDGKLQKFRPGIGLLVAESKRRGAAGWAVRAGRNEAGEAAVVSFRQIACEGRRADDVRAGVERGGDHRAASRRGCSSDQIDRGT